MAEPSIWQELRGDYRVRDGIVGGLFAGLVMTLFAMVVYARFGLGGFWQPINLYAALFHADWGFQEQPSRWPLLLGLAAHLLWSAALGAVGARISRGRASVLLGTVLLSVIAWAVAEVLTLPLFNPTAARWFEPRVLLLSHVVYGLALGLYLLVRGPARAPRGELPGPPPRPA
jgi:hypothetical protein